LIYRVFKATFRQAYNYILRLSLKTELLEINSIDKPVKSRLIVFNP